MVLLQALRSCWNSSQSIKKIVVASFFFNSGKLAAHGNPSIFQLGRRWGQRVAELVSAGRQPGLSWILHQAPETSTRHQKPALRSSTRNWEKVAENNPDAARGNIWWMGPDVQNHHAGVTFVEVTREWIWCLYLISFPSYQVRLIFSSPDFLILLSEYIFRFQYVTS